MEVLFLLGGLLFIILFFISMFVALYNDEIGWGVFGMGISIIFAIICFIISYGFSTVTGTIVDINKEEKFFVIQSEEEDEEEVEQKVRVFVEDWEVNSYKKGEKYVFYRSDIK